MEAERSDTKERTNSKDEGEQRQECGAASGKNLGINVLSGGYHLLENQEDWKSVILWY